MGQMVAAVLFIELESVRDAIGYGDCKSTVRLNANVGSHLEYAVHDNYVYCKMMERKVRALGEKSRGLL